MNLKSVKYKDSRIYVNLERSQKERKVRDAGAFLREFRNVYVVYKIKAFDRQVRETILIKKKDLSVAGSEIALKFELSRLNSPDDCQIEISTLKFNFRGDKSESHSIDETFNFRDIRSIAPIVSEKKELRKNKHSVQKIKTVYVLEERYINKYNGPKPAKISRLDTDKLKESPTSQIEEIEEIEEIKAPINRFKKVSVATDSLTVIDGTTSISTVVSEVESKVQSKLDLETMKLDMDIKQLCYGTFDLLLSNLPLPEFSNEHRASNALVSSIHSYINADLLRQKESEEEGVESA